MPSSSYSSISVDSKHHGKFPTHCKCNPPQLLKMRTSWTQQNPARRFLTCPNSMNALQRCGAYWFVDDELKSEWYKLNLSELHKALNADQRETFKEGMRNRERLEQVTEDFELYKIKKEEENVKLQIELQTLRAKVVMMKKFVIILLLLVVLVLIR